MRVYRVEMQDDCFTGPFTLGTALFVGKSYEADTHPTPREEGIFFEGDEHCGCASLDQLRHWFAHPAVIEALERDGFEVAELEVPDDLVKRGQKQVVFPRREAEPVALHRPSALLAA